jgi:hypothetical protein
MPKTTVSPRKVLPREEDSYRNMLSRCHNPKSTGYKNYGGRGITVCERWRISFWYFFEDMGARPPNMSLDREDNEGNYNKDNCRWATTREQALNTRRNPHIMSEGLTHTLEEWGEIKGLNPNTISTRRARGWSDDACLLPLQNQRRKSYCNRKKT